MAMVVSSQTFLLQDPNSITFSRPTKSPPNFPALNNNLRFSRFPLPKRPFPTLQTTTNPSPSLRVSAFSTSPTIPPPQTTTSSKSPLPILLSSSTRTISTIAAIAFALSKLFSSSIQAVLPKITGISINPNLGLNLIGTVGPLFFAARRDRPSGYLNTPLTVVAAGMAKWLDIYSGILMVRVLLSWFPNIPWDRQPLSAIRDLCDPYLNLFRNIIPPVFDTLDVSPLLAFAVLGTLGSILNNSRGAY